MRRLPCWVAIVGAMSCSGDDVPPAVADATGAGSTAASEAGSAATGNADATSAGHGATGGSSSGSSEGVSDEDISTDSGPAGSDSTGSGATGSGATGSGSTDSDSGSSDSTDSGSGSSGSTDSGSTDSGPGSSDSTDTGSGGPPSCVDVDLGSAIATYFGSTAGLDDSFSPSCLPGSGGNDAGHAFTAPDDGFYIVDTATSSFDTALAIYSDLDCPSVELACNDDVVLSDSSARVSSYLAAGQTRLLVVDGYDAGEVGAYTLTINAILGPCASQALPSATTVMFAGSTLADADKLTPSCAPVPGRDRVLQYVAPVAGTYQIETTGSTFDTVLYVLPAECSTDEVACNDDFGGTMQSRVTIGLAAGETIAIVIDGFGLDEAGDFQLTIVGL